MSGYSMDKIVALCKNRGFVFAGSELYGGLANAWDYGPLGVEMKNCMKSSRREGVAYKRTNRLSMELDTCVSCCSSSM